MLWKIPVFCFALYMAVNVVATTDRDWETKHLEA